MENYEYEKEFPFNSEADCDDDCDSAESEAIKDFLYDYQKNLAKKTHFVLPFAHALFEKTVKDCELVAKEFSGKVKATINYSFFTAEIDLWCCYVEFRYGEFMSILQKISLFAISIQFTPLTSGDLHIKIQMPYFISSQDP